MSEPANFALPDRLEAGAPYPLGATPDGLGVNFAVYSAHATAIDLCVFDPAGKREIARYALPEHTDEIWHGYLPQAGPGLVYGFRAHGAYAPERGHRFNAHKLLLDPYAKRILGQARWTDALHGYRVHSSRGDLSFDRRDSAPAAPKSVVVADAFDWGDDRAPATPWDQTVIYEAHAKGLTRLMSEVPAPLRGTFAALGHPALIDHLKSLGVTALQLLPIHAILQDRFLHEKGLVNYWGYNTLSYFAPEPRYMARPGNGDELRVAIRRLHAAGIEVILDMVYNHTCEGGERGPTLCWRGLDHAGYYRLQADNRRHCVNDTGTGNTVDASNPHVIRMIMDSLRHWATSYRVDGFRFDLSVTLGRETHGFDPGAGFFDALRQDPVLARTKLIAEPWDIGPGGYQLGRHPPGFAEWNDRFRDGVRRYWRGDEGARRDLAARLAGSADLFDHRGRRPWASVNYVASHDGYTLADAVSYERRHNEANGEGNRDGHAANYSRNWGVEGPTDDPAIRETRGRVARAMLTTVFSALGTPMLLAGDEFGRSQSGNNNAYAQDNEISWLDWAQADAPEGRALAEFVARLARLRLEHPLLRYSRFLHGAEVAPGVRDVEWFDETGATPTPDHWNDHGHFALAMRRASKGEDGAVTMILFLANASSLSVDFHLPPPEANWRLLVDSACPEREEGPVAGGSFTLDAHGAALLAAEILVD
ncbi:MAG: glycogen debranching enzyme GlgX [Salinarimonadaceae bacterium]|nr:MAG: glycogen debranching enzyme GlgX [Salinarimonadaceae bacterium]